MASTLAVVLGVLLAALSLVIIALAATLAILVYKRKRSKTRPYIDSIPNNELQSKTKHRRIKLDEFDLRLRELRQDNNFMLDKEFEHLSQMTTAQKGTVRLSAAIVSDSNQRKNRFVDIIPAEENRVKLQNNGSRGDYINASFIDGYNQRRAYIAAQGSLGPEETGSGRHDDTRADFWLMIWQQKVCRILMLTRLTEAGKSKCAQYWPSEAGTSAQYGRLSVQLDSEQQLSTGIVKRRLLASLGDQPCRTVEQWHVTGWHDHQGTEPQLLLGLLDAVNADTPEHVFEPTLVHCSAGVGRTGTLIALHIINNQLAANNQVIDIFHTVYTLRKQRFRMVQTKEQYMTLYECVGALLSRRQSLQSLPDVLRRVFNTCSSTGDVTVRDDSDTESQAI